jgi:hypothetical protein
MDIQKWNFYVLVTSSVYNFRLIEYLPHFGNLRLELYREVGQRLK